MKKVHKKAEREGFLIVIADDLTGAMDTGACFVMQGCPALVIVEPTRLDNNAAIPKDFRILSVNTASRASDPQEAYMTVSRCARRLSSLPILGVYKKIDSTLRGQIGVEVDAVMDALSFPLAFITPAFPQQGRRTVGGIHMMDGQPIGATEMRHDPVMPVVESRVPALLNGQSRRLAALVDLISVAGGEADLEQAIRRQTESGAQLLIFDAVRREHLRSVARAVLNRGWDVLPVGSGGLAREMAEEMGLSPPRLRLSMQKKLPGGPVLVVCGSRSQRSLRQVARLCEITGAALISLSADCRIEEGLFSADKLARTAGAVERTLEKRSVVLTLEIDESFPTRALQREMAGKIIKALATVCCIVMDARETPPAGLILTGGDTAFGVLQKLRISELELFGEISPGIPLAFVHSGRFEGLPVITKAGAFGGPDALVRCVKYLEKKIEINKID